METFRWIEYEPGTGFVFVAGTGPELPVGDFIIEVQEGEPDHIGQYYYGGAFHVAPAQGGE